MRLLFASLVLAFLFSCSCSEGSPHWVVELTEDNFDSLVSTGIWMVDVYAPWCSHCRQLTPVWEKLAQELGPGGIKVAKIDGTREKLLVKRFHVQAFPSIFLLRDGQTWEYKGPRTLKALSEFALEGYKKAKALPYHKAPNSLVGRVLGELHSLPLLAKKTYNHLRQEVGLSDLAIVAAFLSIPVMLGAAAICVVDGIYIRRAKQQHAHYE